MTRPVDWLNEKKDHKSIQWERPRQTGDPIGHKRYQVEISLGAMHVPDSVQAWKRGENVEWQNLNIKWVASGNKWIEGNVFYRVEVSQNKIGVLYTSRQEGNPTFQLELTHIDGSPIGAIPTPQVIGNTLRWVDVEPGLTFYLRLGDAGIEMRKRITTAAAPRNWKWSIIESNDLLLHPRQDARGRDNINFTEPSREGLGPNRIRRKVEMVTVVTQAPSSPPGKSRYTIEETWTGKTWEVDEITRIKSLSTDFVLPIDIDVSMPEQAIAADADDGCEYQNENWFNSIDSLIYVSDAGYWKSWPGWRFATVPLPAGATIDSATFSVETSRTGGGDIHGSLFAIASDDPVTWSSGSIIPSLVTPTAANAGAVTWNDLGDGEDKDVVVTSIVQELVNRGGWNTGQAMSFFDDTVFPDVQGDYVYFMDKNSGTGFGRLNVEYTVGGGGLIVSSLHKKPLRQMLTR